MVTARSASTIQTPNLEVLVLAWEFPPLFAGGVGIVGAALARAVAQAGCHVTYVLPYALPDGDFVEGDLRVTGLSEEGPVDPEGSFSPYGTPAGLGHRSVLRPSLYGPGLLQEIEGFAQTVLVRFRNGGLPQPDVIHAHDWTSFPAAAALSAASGVPWVAHVHITEYDKSGGTYADPSVYTVERAGVHGADKVIAVSGRIAETLVARYGADPGNVEVVHNAFESLGAEAPPVGKGDPMVLFLGRVTLQKGPNYFLEAARQALEVDPSLWFVVAGDGDQLLDLIERTAAMGIGDRVLFAGFVDREEVAALFARASVFVMPSVSEPFGIVSLEAMDARIPAIVSRQSGASEVIHHALKVDFWDTQDLASKILALTRYPAVSDEMGLQGQREARRRSWSSVADQVIGIFRSVSSNA